MATSKGTQTSTDKEVRYVSVTKSLNLRVDSFENIDDVKDKSSDFEGIESKVFFTKSGFENGQELDVDRKDGSNVHLNLHLGVRLQVNIKVSWGATTTDDKLISLDVYSWDTIGVVKSKFQDKEGTPANQLTLFYDGKQLDDLQTIAGYAIGNHATLDAFFLGEDKIKISVRPPGGLVPIEVMVKLCSTVFNLKRMIHCMGHYAVDRQELTFNRVLLENSLRLADFKIQMGSVIDLDFITRTRNEDICEDNERKDTYRLVQKNWYLLFIWFKKFVLQLDFTRRAVVRWNLLLFIWFKKFVIVYCYLLLFVVIISLVQIAMQYFINVKGS